MRKKIAIIGEGKTGESIKRLLAKLKKPYIQIANSKNQEVNLKNIKLIIKSPSVPLWDKLILQACEQNIKVISDIEYFFRLAKCKIVAVTGTNGKTTVCTLLQHILGRKSVAIGNIGKPVCDYAKKLKKSNIAIVECSSYQLEGIEKFQPNIAVITNIFADHLEHHKNEQKYFEAKKKIFSRMQKKDFALLNVDDKKIAKLQPNAKIYYFSTKKIVKKGVFLHNDKFYFVDKKLEFICKAKSNLKGEHNLSNIAICILIAKLLHTKNQTIAKKISNFEGIKHRIEFVQQVDGIEFYNDSKSTNSQSTVVACNSFSCNITLLLGGRKNCEDYEDFFQNLPKNVKNIVLFGESGAEFSQICEENNINFYLIEFDNKQDKNLQYGKEILHKVLNLSQQITQKGEVVLFSPACKSFDMFTDFEERGNVFSCLVKNLKK